MDKSKLDKKDFSASINHKGFMLQYKGKDIGGAGTIESSYQHVRKSPKTMQADHKMYSEMVKREINKLVEGRGQQRFYDVIEKINKLKK